MEKALHYVQDLLLYVRVYMCESVWLWVCEIVCVCMCVCVCVFMFVCVYVYVMCVCVCREGRSALPDFERSGAPHVGHVHVCARIRFWLFFLFMLTCAMTLLNMLIGQTYGFR